MTAEPFAGALVNQCGAHCRGKSWDEALLVGGQAG
jgi:hypothetical protein